MIKNFQRFLNLPDQAKFDVYESTAGQIETSPAHVEKDFWVCLVLEILFNHLPEGHPKLLFKGGTSLTKAFGLIRRFSEDIDVTVFRDSLGFSGDNDPTLVKDLSNNKRRALFDKLQAECSEYIQGELQAALANKFDELKADCQITPDPSDISGQTLFVEYPTLYQKAGGYVQPRVKLESGARSALEPNRNGTVTPYIAMEFPEWSFEVDGIRVFSPERTYLDKLLILHGAHCGYRDAGRLPKEGHRISRHYYDIAVITSTEVGQSALLNTTLLDDVRKHNLIAFRQSWKKLDEAVPGTMRLVPQNELSELVEEDYHLMRNMIFGDRPDFGWIINQISHAESIVNRVEH